MEFRENTKYWYVIITKPRFQKKVGCSLTEFGIENFIPLQKQVRQWSDRKKIIEVPVFLNYAFVRSTEKDRLNVFKANGIRRFLSIGGSIVKVRDCEIDRIKRLLQYEKDINIEPNIRSFEKGQKVEIIVGSLRGLTGEMFDNCEAGSKKVKIGIKSLGCFACVEISSEDLSICTERKMVS